MYNTNRLQEYMVNKKVLIYHGADNKDYKYYIKEINNDLVSIVVDAPIKTSMWESDHQLWTIGIYNLISNSEETNYKANWGKKRKDETKC